MLRKKLRDSINISFLKWISNMIRLYIIEHGFVCDGLTVRAI